PVNTPFSTVKITWNHDALGRLVTEQRDGGTLGTQDGDDYTANYAFDLANNRTKYAIDKVGTSADDTILYANNVRDEMIAETLDATTTTGYAYDFNGSMISKKLGASPADTYTWDLRNRMIGATVGGV